MAENTVRAKFEADASGYIKAMGEAEKATNKLGDAADKTGQSTKKLGDDANKSTSGWTRMGQAIRDNSADMQTVGTGLTVVGAGITAVAGASAKFAMDWQSDWAGVQKTNDGTAAQMEQLEGDLRELARTLPATHTEIAATAEAAGQLGVGVDDVASFSRVMIDLGETTNLSADEAATALARFSNVMGTAFSDADRLGSTIVGLGNNFATTEKEIVDMAQRIAPVGRILNMTEADTLAMATAMSSVGINAEAGGTAISMVMRKIDAAVREGGDSLIGWADAAGVSAEDFAAKWQERPAEAMQILSQGLGETAAAGGDVNAILGDLGVRGIRESATMLSLASASGVLTDALAMGSEEWANNTALAAEAELRYETAESKIAIAWNNIKDAAINAGSVILPVIADVADTIADVAGWFADLPAPVTGAITALSGVAGVGLAAAGGLLLVAPRVMDTVDAFGRLLPKIAKANQRFPRTAGFIKNLGIAAGVAAIAIAGLRILDEVISDKNGDTVQTITNRLLEMSQAADEINLDNLFGNYDEYLGVSTGVDTIGEAIDRVMNKDWIDGLDGWAAGIIGVESEMQVLEGRFADIGTAMADMFAGGQTEQASEMFRELAGAFEEAGYSAEDALNAMPAYRDAILNTANAAGESLTQQELLAVAMGEVAIAGPEAGDGAEAAAGGMDDLGDSAEDAAASLDDIIAALTLLGQINRSEMQATADFEASMDGLTESLKENGNTLDVTTEKGRANQAAFLDLADSGWALATAQAEAGATNHELQGTLQDTYDTLVTTAEGMGMTGDQAAELAGQILGIPPGVDIESWMSTAAMEIATATGTAVDEITDWKKVDVVVTEDGTAGEVQEQINQVTGKTELVVVDDNGTTHRVQERIENINGVNRTVLVDDNGTVWGVQKDIDGIKDGKATVHADANTAQAESQLNHTARDRTSTITQTVRQNLLKTTLNIPAPSGGRGILRPEFNRATGGRLPRRATGGRLPYTGLGTDMILGIGSHGLPTARVDDGEWVIREENARKYDRALDLINQDHPAIQHLAAYESGGSVGRQWSAAQAVASYSSGASIDYDRLGKVIASNGGSVLNVTMQVPQGAGVGEIVSAFDHAQRKAGRA
ncbi:phage tail tape measure protein [Citricoccus sp. NR2]|uniref:phage tail tape measure protein n=1 Tax=Citricoccus sp. NR2 TaxID=3004095 RepID=UPI0022DDA246|nr:phage tail tape measure protein [Citricoccus sp. NR2]WBL18522.1 phage tail tape measure protein [Citricoccus sp. NR2]